MRFFILILASLFAFGMPEVRANESLEETVEVVVSYSANQTTVAKRLVRALPAVPKASPKLATAPAIPPSTSPAAKSLFLEHRVLRL